MFWFTMRAEQVLFAWVDADLEAAVRRGEFRREVAYLEVVESIDDLQSFCALIDYATAGVAMCLQSFCVDRALRLSGHAARAEACQAALGWSPQEEQIVDLWETVRLDRRNSRWLKRLDKIAFGGPWPGAASVLDDVMSQIPDLVRYERWDREREDGSETRLGRHDRLRRRTKKREDWDREKRQQQSWDGDQFRHSPLPAFGELDSSHVEPRALLENSAFRGSDPSEERREREAAAVVSEKAHHSEREAMATLVLARTGQQADTIAVTGNRAVEPGVRKAKKVEEEIRSEFE
jgi:hypothetical protein